MESVPPSSTNRTLTKSQSTFDKRFSSSLHTRWTLKTLSTYNNKPLKNTTSEKRHSFDFSFDSGDQAHIVGDGRNRDHPCANCCIQ